MLRINFTPQDLARMRIAAEPDPLWEVLLSLHMAQSPAGELVYGNWRRSANTTARHTDLVLLRELAPPNGYSPDFLTPPAGGSDLDEALDHLISTPRTDVRAQLDYLASRRAATPWTRALASGKSDPMRRLGGAVRSYHETAIAPYWRSIRGHVIADRARRVQQWTSHGVDDFLANLHPRVRWTPPVLQIFDFVDTDVYLQGRGLLLQPSFFCWQAPTKLRDTDLPPVLVYPTQPPPGTLHRLELGGTHVTRHSSLAALLGRTRAEALEATAAGCTTSELALLCGVSVAAASQQATVLREAGLITTRREGGAVRHEITGLGLNLLDGAGLPV